MGGGTPAPTCARTPESSATSHATSTSPRSRSRRSCSRCTRRSAELRSLRLLSSALVVCLLAVAGLGCGASEGGTATTGSRTSADPARLAAESDRAQAVIDDASGSQASLQWAALSQQLSFRQLADRRPLRRPTLARLTPRARSAAKASLRASDAL